MSKYHTKTLSLLNKIYRSAKKDRRFKSGCVRYSQATKALTEELFKSSDMDYTTVEVYTGISRSTVSRWRRSMLDAQKKDSQC